MPDTTTPGVAAFVQALAKHVDDARFSISHVPHAVLTGLKNGGIRAKFDRVEVQGRLPDGSKAKAYLDIAAVEPSLPNGPVSTHIEAGALDLSESLALLCYAADVQPEAPSTPARQAPEPQAVTPAPATPEPAPAAAPAPPTAPEKDYKPIIFGVLVVILVLAIVMRLNREDKPAVATVDTPAQTATTPATAPKPEDTKPANSEWSTKDGVRPAWADRAFSIDNNRVLIVGEASSKQAGCRSGRRPKGGAGHLDSANPARTQRHRAIHDALVGPHRHPRKGRRNLPAQAAVYSLEQLKGLTTQKEFLRLVVNSNSVAKTVTVRAPSSVP